MSDASAAALRRKVGGTKSGFFGETVDVKGKYVEQGYISSKGTEVAYLPFIVLVGASRPQSCCACAGGSAASFCTHGADTPRTVLGIVAATVVVVARTG